MNNLMIFHFSSITLYNHNPGLIRASNSIDLSYKFKLLSLCVHLNK